MKRLSPSIAMLLVAAMIATSCASAPGASTPSGQAAADKPKSGGTIRYGLVRDPIHFDPHVSAGQSSVSLQGSSA